MKASLITNVVLTLFVLLILCNSRRIEKYVKEESDDPVIVMEPAVEPEVVAPVVEAVEEELVEEPAMEEPLAPGEPLEEVTQVEQVDDVTTDLALPTFKMPPKTMGDLGYYGFAKMMYF